MSHSLKPELLLAAALYEVRLLLASYLGSANTAELPVRVAAHLAYALHNDALAVLEGKPFQVDAALARIKAVDRIVGKETNLVERLAAHARGSEV
jgi:hypothetical protein